MGDVIWLKPICRAYSQLAIVPMSSLTHVCPTSSLSAMFITCLAVAAHAGPTDCELNKVALARVVAKDARLHFIAGASKRGCPSAERACRLRAYLVPADEILVDAGDGPYVCAFFKSPGVPETRAFLPRTVVQIAPRGGSGAAMGRQLGPRSRGADHHQLQRRRGGGIGQRRVGQLRPGASQKGRRACRRTRRQRQAAGSDAGDRIRSGPVRLSARKRRAAGQLRREARALWPLPRGRGQPRVRRPEREFHRNLCASEISAATGRAVIPRQLGGRSVLSGACYIATITERPFPGKNMQEREVGPRCLRDWIDRSAQHHPDKLCIVSAENGRAITYGELRSLTGRIAAYLRGRGLGPNDRVALIADNSIEHLGCYL